MTSFMRVTKQPKTHGKKVGASHPGIKQQVRRDAIVDKQETTGLSDEESRAHVPTFIYKVRTIHWLPNDWYSNRVLFPADYTAQTVKYQSSHEKHEVSEEIKTVIAYIKAREFDDSRSRLRCSSLFVIDTVEILQRTEQSRAGRQGIAKADSLPKCHGAAFTVHCQLRFCFS